MVKITEEISETREYHCNDMPYKASGKNKLRKSVILFLKQFRKIHRDAVNFPDICITFHSTIESNLIDQVAKNVDEHLTANNENLSTSEIKRKDVSCRSIDSIKTSIKSSLTSSAINGSGSSKSDLSIEKSTINTFNSIRSINICSERKVFEEEFKVNFVELKEKGKESRCEKDIFKLSRSFGDVDLSDSEYSTTAVISQTLETNKDNLPPLLNERVSNLFTKSTSAIVQYNKNSLKSDEKDSIESKDNDWCVSQKLLHTIESENDLYNDENVHKSTEHSVDDKIRLIRKKSDSYSRFFNDDFENIIDMDTSNSTTNSTVLKRSDIIPNKRLLLTKTKTENENVHKSTEHSVDDKIRLIRKKSDSYSRFFNDDFENIIDMDTSDSTTNSTVIKHSDIIPNKRLLLTKTKTDSFSKFFNDDFEFILTDFNLNQSPQSRGMTIFNDTIGSQSSTVDIFTESNFSTAEIQNIDEEISYDPLYEKKRLPIKRNKWNTKSPDNKNMPEAKQPKITEMLQKVKNVRSLSKNTKRNKFTSSNGTNQKITDFFALTNKTTDGFENLETVPNNPMRVIHLTNETIQNLKAMLYGNKCTVLSINLIKRHECQKDSSSSGDILMSITEGEGDKLEYYYLAMPPARRIFKSSKELFEEIFKSKCRKIIYDGQRLLKLIVNIFQLNSVLKSTQFFDIFVALWMLDPDHPPKSFSEAIKLLNIDLLLDENTNHIMKECNKLKMLTKSFFKVQQNLKDCNLWNTFVDVEMKILPILTGMDMKGIKINKYKFQEMRAILKNHLEIIQNRCNNLIGRTVDLNRTVQIRQILYDELKLDQLCKVEVRKTVIYNEKSTTKAMLLKMINVHPLPGLIIDYKELHKEKSTYIDAIMNVIRNDCLHTTWKQTSIGTGRIVSTDPNLQAIPKEQFIIQKYSGTNEKPTISLRSPYISRSGYTFFSINFQNIEFRIFAYLARDKLLLSAFKSSEDIFANLATIWTGDKYYEYSEAEQRNRMKKIMYSVMYDVGAGKLSDMLNITYDDSFNIIKSFTDTFSGIKTYKSKLILLCKNQGYLTSFSGRRRYFPDINSSDFEKRSYNERQAVNFVIQGSVADICKTAMILTNEALNTSKINFSLLLQIHDELMWEIYDPDFPVAIGVIKSILEDTSALTRTFGIKDLNLPYSIYSGKVWDEMNPP